MWLIKWFQSCFLYSFPFDLCIRAWDNILAYGTRFLFNMTLAILKSVETQLLELDMAEICEFMKLMKQEDGQDQQDNILKPVEELIEDAQRIFIPNERLKALFRKHKVKTAAPKKEEQPQS